MMANRKKGKRRIFPIEFLIISKLSGKTLAIATIEELKNLDLDKINMVVKRKK